MIAQSAARLPPLLLAGLIVGGLSLASAPARAQAGPAPAVREPPARDRDLVGLAFSFDVYGVSRLDDAYDLWESGEDWTAVGLEVSYDAVRLGESTRLALALGLMTEEQEGRTPGAEAFPSRISGRAGFDGRLESTSLHLGALVRWRTDRALQPYVGLAVGGTRSDLTLDPYFMPVASRSRAYGLLGRATLGLRVQPAGLRLKKRNGAPLIAIGLGLELGALAGTPLEHEASAEAPTYGRAEPQPIAVQKVALGALAPNGAYTRLALVVVF